MTDRLTLHTIVLNPSSKEKPAPSSEGEAKIEKLEPRQRIREALNDIRYNHGNGSIMGYEHAEDACDSVRNRTQVYPPEEFDPGIHLRRIVVVAARTENLTERVRDHACAWLLKHGKLWLPPQKEEKKRGFSGRSKKPDPIEHTRQGLFDFGYPFLLVPWALPSETPEVEFVLIGGPCFCLRMTKPGESPSLSEIEKFLKRAGPTERKALHDCTPESSKSPLQLKLIPKNNEIVERVACRIGKLGKGCGIELVEDGDAAQMFVQFGDSDAKEHYPAYGRVVSFCDVKDGERPGLYVHYANSPVLKYRYEVKAPPEEWEFWGEYVTLAIVSHRRSIQFLNRLGA